MVGCCDALVCHVSPNAPKSNSPLTPGVCRHGPKLAVAKITIKARLKSADSRLLGSWVAPRHRGHRNTCVDRRLNLGTESVVSPSPAGPEGGAEPHRRALEQWRLLYACYIDASIVERERIRPELEVWAPGAQEALDAAHVHVASPSASADGTEDTLMGVVAWLDRQEMSRCHADGVVVRRETLGTPSPEHRWADSLLDLVDVALDDLSKG